MNGTNPNGNPGYGGGPGGGMRVINSTITEFVGFVLNDAVALPVVDQTGSAPRGKLVLKWTPDAYPVRSYASDSPGPRGRCGRTPGHFRRDAATVGTEAGIEELTVDVMVIDHVEKPSPN